MADAAGEHEEVEDGVHEAALAHGVEDGTGDEADALGYNPDDSDGSTQWTSGLKATSTLRPIAT